MIPETDYEPLLRPKMPELDSIRGLAIIGVVVHHGLFMATLDMRLPRWEHFLILPGWLGRLGVNLFFVLSGFLITGILLDSPREHYFRRFYVRRALRIFPIYFVILGVLILAGYSGWFVALSFFYLSNFAPLIGVDAYPVIWSLAVEEHFYLIWPALVRRLSPNALTVICVAVIALSPLVRLLTSHPENMDWSFYTWNNMDGLACGAFLALFIRKTNQSRAALTVVCWILLMLAVAIEAAGLPFGILTRHRPVGAALQVVPWQFLFVSLLGAFILIGSGPYKAWVQVPVLKFFGEISYGLYLIHMLVFSGFDRLARATTIPLVLVRFVCGTVIAILLAYLSRWYFEERFLRLKGKFGG